jgi:hypothetical protein
MHYKAKEHLHLIENVKEKRAKYEGLRGTFECRMEI